MFIHRLQLKQFRCFDEFTITLEAPLVLISGHNGTGKTSLLEALHYACYLRSFRTHLPKDLVAFHQQTFFIKAWFSTAIEEHELQIGFSPASKKRLVKIDQHPVQSHKELIDYYRVITVTTDDLMLIQGGPELRRSYIDQALLLSDAAYAHNLRVYKQVLNNRNALLQQGYVQEDSYLLWTQRLWEITRTLQQQRIEGLLRIQERVSILIAAFFATPVTLTCNYKPYKSALEGNFEEFLAEFPRLKTQEQTMRRSLFGAHLDDIALVFQHHSSKAFASRGQQKMITLLLKAAQLQELAATKGKAVLLLDDVMTDLDAEKIPLLLDLIQSLDCQMIITSPLHQGVFEKAALARGAQEVCLTG